MTAMVQELESFVQAHSLPSTRTEITLSPTKSFLAQKLGYSVTGNTRNTVPWDSVCMAVLLILCSSVAIGLDVALLNTVDGFGNFMTSSGMVGGNILRGASVWLHDQNSYVLGRLDMASDQADDFHSNLKEWTVTLSALSAAQEKKLEGAVETGSKHLSTAVTAAENKTRKDLSSLAAAGEKTKKKISALVAAEESKGSHKEAARWEVSRRLSSGAGRNKKNNSDLQEAESHWIHLTSNMTKHEINARFKLAKPALRLLNSTLTTVRGYTHKFVKSLVPLRKYLESKVKEFKHMYESQMKSWMKVLGIQADARAKQKKLTPAMTFFHNVTDRLGHALQEFDAFTTSFKQTVRMEDVDDEVCFEKFDSAVDNLAGKSDEQFRNNVATLFNGTLNISWIFVGALGGIRAKTDLLEDLDNNLSHALDSLQSMLDHVDDLMGEAKDRRLSSLSDRIDGVKAHLVADLDHVANATRGVTELLLNLLESGAEKSLFGIISHVNETFHLLERRANGMGSVAKDVEAYPTSFFNHYASSTFSSAKIWNMFMASVLCLLAGLGSCWLLRYLSNFEHRMEDLVSRCPESLPGLCAFHPHVQELDTTAEASMVRPMERAWLRVKFVFEYQKLLMCTIVTFFVSVIGLVIFIGWTMLDPIIMSLVVSVLGGVCRATNSEILIHESTCHQSLVRVSDMLSGASIMPGENCASSDLLLCSDFFDPMGKMLVVEMALKLFIAILLFVISHNVPGEIYRMFAQASQDIVAKIVTEGTARDC